MDPIVVLENADTVAAALSPLRRRILSLLETPHSATSLARELQLPRQKVNYHVRELERIGLVRLVAERRRRGLTERIFQSVADRILIDPLLLDRNPTPAHADQFAAEHLASTAARAVHDIGALMRGAAASDQRLATFTLDAELTFATPGDLRAFVAELGDLVVRYDRPADPEGRRHRFIAMSHPTSGARR